MVDDIFDTEDTETGGPTEELPEDLAEHRGDHPYLILVRGDSSTRLFKLEKVDTIIGRSGNADIPLRDTAISREHCLVTCLPDGRVRLRDLGSTNGTFYRGDRIAEVVLREGDKFQLGLNTVLKFTYEEILKEEFQEALYTAAIKDSLTQIYNKRVLIEQLRLEFVYYRRFKRPLSLCLMDLDHFKRVNETWGYQAGDRLLASVAKFLAGSMRAADVFARYGGEEFAVILRETDQEQAAVFAERMLRAMEAAQFTVTDRNGDPQTISLTMSLGIATLQNENYATPEELIEHAITSLSEAKSWGRNRVVMRPELKSAG
ncbi:MAG TPA: GGDEF domain-containing protein [Myxococcaceae bacterium]|nr:GGDEF domain-containing protein [Myxococcaceae bacterium]